MILRNLRYIKLSYRLIEFQRIETKRLLSDDLRNRLNVALNESQDIKFVPFQIQNAIFGGKFEVSVFLTDNEGRFRRHIEEEAVKKHVSHRVGFKYLFRAGFKTLQEYLDARSFSKDSHILPVAALLNFLENKEFHEESLRGIIYDEDLNRESDVATVLAIHLFSKLGLDEKSSYMITNDHYLKYRMCPCGNKDCKYNVIYGNTGMGSEDLFNGKPDIVVFPYGSGSTSIVVPCSDKSGSSYDELQKFSENSSMTMVEENKNISSLRYENTIEQFSTLAITFSFYQRLLQHRGLTPPKKIVSLIPTIAVCKDSFDIYMYDTENDIFIRNKGPPIPLWEVDEESQNSVLSIPSVLRLWMVVNHLSFRPKIPKQLKILNGSCGFIPLITDEKWERIEKTLRMSSRFKPLQVQETIFDNAIAIECGQYDQYDSDDSDNDKS